MWHDDDGEDDPIPGPVPEPSARHWRHPSELARQHALPNPDPTPVPLLHPSQTPSMRRPLTVVGGCIAVAAAGVMALTLARAGEPTMTTGTSSAASAGAGLDLAGGDRSPDDTGFEPTALPTTEDDGPTAVEAGPDDGADPQTPDVDASDDLLGGETAIHPSEGAEEAEPAEPAPEPAPMALLSVYARLDSTEAPLASFVRVDDHLITSASSIGRRQTVWLRIGDRWSKTAVAATDPLTDVALLAPVDPETILAVPPLETGDAAPEVGSAAAVGYGMQIDTDGDAVPDTIIDSLIPEAPAVVVDGGSAGLETSKVAPDSDPSIASRAVTGGEQAWQQGPQRGAVEETFAGATPEQTSPNPGRPDPIQHDPSEPDGDQWVDASPSRGWIYSLRQPLRTLGGRVVYEPIRTGIDRVTGDAGAPLRNAEGQLIGLVLGTDSPQVAALPIERAIEVAESLYRWGVGHLAWVGVETSPVDGGLRVVKVNPTGPAAALEPGDLILAVDQIQVTHPDHFQHLVRQAGPGTTLSLTVDRRGDKSIVGITVATVALP